MSSSNYRPISLLSVSSKILEHYICDHITTFLKRDGFFALGQHGFHRGLSTITQLVERVQVFTDTLNAGGHIDVCFLTFQKPSTLYHTQNY